MTKTKKAAVQESEESDNGKPKSEKDSPPGYATVLNILLVISSNFLLVLKVGFDRMLNCRYLY